MTISEKETQEIIYNYAGKGVMGRSRNGTYITEKEYVSVGKAIGAYYENGEWHSTDRVMIVYSKNGSHVVPVSQR